MSELYDRITSLCADHGISGYKLCKSTGMQPSVLTDLKMGRQSGLSAKNADRIASFFGVSVGYLLGTEEKKKPDDGMKSWYPPLRFWDKINDDRPRFMHYFLRSWEYPIEDITRLWNVSVDSPEQAEDDVFRDFLLNTVKAVRLNPEDGEWDVVIIPPKKAPTSDGERNEDPDIYRIERAKKRMSSEEWAKQMRIIEASFGDYFSDDYEDDDVDE